MLQAITFDCWDTLMVARTDRVRELRRSALRGIFDSCDPAAIDAALDAGIAAYKRAWHDDRPFDARAAAVVIADVLGCPSGDRVDLVVEVLAAGDDDPQLTPGVAQVLKDLHSLGIRLGIICDVAMTPSPALRNHLDRLGVLAAFDHWSFSDEVGYFKPNPVIFHHAHTGLGVRHPSATAHVGDLRRTDIQGALGVGSAAVRYAGANDDRSTGPEGDFVIDSHADLIATLGLS